MRTATLILLRKGKPSRNKAPAPEWVVRITHIVTGEGEVKQDE
ncbi:hypothetical protein [Brevibacillus brevis]|nr:hypothetical protein [Brevibacillus brevis]